MLAALQRHKRVNKVYSKRRECSGACYVIQERKRNYVEGHPCFVVKPVLTSIAELKFILNITVKNALLFFELLLSFVTQLNGRAPGHTRARYIGLHTFYGAYPAEPCCC